LIITKGIALDVTNSIGFAQTAGSRQRIGFSTASNDQWPALS
jgi:hypothetical protein